MPDPQTPALSPHGAAWPRCPKCESRMEVQHITSARSGFEHSTLRCTECRLIHEALVNVPRAGWSPKLVPYGADQTIYLVVDSFSASGTVYRETEVERTDFETIIADFLTGQFNDPVRVIAFNTLEHWSDDVSEAIATEIQTRCDIEGVSVPEHVGDFVDRYKGPVRQLTLKLA